MEIQLKITGVVLIILALVHVLFPRYFNWKEEFQKVSLVNTQMMYVHTFFIGFTVLLMGVLCVSATEELIHTAFGRKIALGFSVFWGIRLGIQFFGYSVVLWKGKTFETIVHIVFVVLWLYLTLLFLYVYWHC